jgi:pilus assembly protein Flp/PilA
MIRYIRNVTTFNKDEGASAVEYGLLVAAIAAIIVLLVFAVGKFVKAGFQETCDGIDTNASAEIQAAADCA